MKHLITLLLLTFSTIGFSQSGSIIVGKVLDKELNNEPLMFAKVSVKGSNLKATSDATGLFYIENLKDGDYTLVCSFPGYESKEIKVQVNAFQSTDINVVLGAKTISINDLALLQSNTPNTQNNSSISLN